MKKFSLLFSLILIFVLVSTTFVFAEKNKGNFEGEHKHGDNKSFNQNADRPRDFFGPEIIGMRMKDDPKMKDFQNKTREIMKTLRDLKKSFSVATNDNERAQIKDKVKAEISKLADLRLQMLEYRIEKSKELLTELKNKKNENIDKEVVDFLANKKMGFKNKDRYDDDDRHNKNWDYDDNDYKKSKKSKNKKCK